MIECAAGHGMPVVSVRPQVKSMCLIKCLHSIMIHDKWSTLKHVRDHSGQCVLNRTWMPDQAEPIAHTARPSVCYSPDPICETTMCGL